MKIKREYIDDLLKIGCTSFAILLLLCLATLITKQDSLDKAYNKIINQQAKIDNYDKQIGQLQEDYAKVEEKVNELSK